MKFKCLSAVFASSYLKQPGQLFGNSARRQQSDARGVTDGCCYLSSGFGGCPAHPQEKREAKLDAVTCTLKHCHPTWQGTGSCPESDLMATSTHQGCLHTVCLGKYKVSNRYKSTTCLISWANNQLFRVQIFFLPGTYVWLFLAALFYKSTLARWWQLYLLPESVALVSIYRSQPKSVLDIIWTELEIVMKNTDRAFFFLDNYLDIYEPVFNFTNAVLAILIF